MPRGHSHANYDRLNTEASIDGQPIERFRLTQLHLPTGEIVATDPLVYPEAPPYVRTVPPGTYPVDLYLAGEGASARVAAAALIFAPGTPVHYELALRAGQSLEALETDDHYFGFAVDAGLGSFADRLTSERFNAFTETFEAEHPKGNVYDDLLAELFRQNARHPEDPRDIGNWLDFHLPDAPEFQIAMFQSGYGDGVFPVYWGVDAEGRALSLVIDFQVLEFTS